MSEKKDNSEVIDREDGIGSDQFNKHKLDADVALTALQNREGPPLVLDEATNRRLLRKIDWHLLPIMCFVYGLNFLDKTTLSYASITGLQQDIHISGADYSWLGSIFYFGYLAWE